MRKRECREGFTLVELMIVVVILAVLAVVAIASYKRYVAKAQAEEARGLLMDIKSKQEAYFSLYSQYVSTAASETALYPNTNATSAEGNDLKNMWRWDTMSCTGTPSKSDLGWCHLGFKPMQDTYFRFVTIGWNPKQTLLPGSSAHPFVQKVDPTRRWFYAIAHADLDYDGTFSTFIMTSQHNAIVAINENE